MKITLTTIALVLISIISSTKSQAQTEADSCFLNVYAINWSTTFGGVYYALWADSITLVDSGYFMSGDGGGSGLHENTTELWAGATWTFYNAITSMDPTTEIMPVVAFKPMPGVDSVHYTYTLTTLHETCTKVLQGYMLFHPDGSVDTARTNEAYREAMRAAGVLPPDGSTSTNKLDLDNNVSVYPNPVLDNAEIIVKGGYVISAELHDLTGKKLIQSNNKILNLSNVSSGMYFLRINTSKGIVTRKISKF